MGKCGSFITVMEGNARILMNSRHAHVVVKPKPIKSIEAIVLESKISTTTVSGKRERGREREGERERGGGGGGREGGRERKDNIMQYYYS